jgi:hypothetical protein
MRQGRHEALANGLGWFSIALGLAELLMPRQMARATGLEGRERLIQLYGAREIATGVAILLSADKTIGMWARVGGDALDGATLATGDQPRAGVALAAVTPIVATDVWTAARLQQRRNKRRRPVFDYSERSGFPKPPDEMRGIARKSPAAQRAPVTV